METKRGKTRWEKGERVERGKGKFELCGDENKRGLGGKGAKEAKSREAMNTKC